ncbi:MAG: DUF748 domain-containing protein [Candidatus Omnitrophica bacterium]|nr:DUF748 domain-containing protein [Candidatus Omnitrophota bacterium]
MRKRLFFIILFILMLGTIAYFYINNVFLPIKFKGFVEQKLEEALGRKVSIAQIDFSLIKGLSAKEIRIYKKDSEKELLLDVEKINFSLIIAPLLKEKKVIIPYITISSPVINIERLDDNTFSFFDILEKKNSPLPDEPKEATKKSSPFSFFIRQVNIRLGTINFTDYAQKEIFTETVKNINLSVTISLAKNISFAFSTNIPRTEGSIKASGQLGLSPRKIAARLEAFNLEAGRYFSLHKFTDAFELKNSNIVKADIEVKYQDKQGSANGSFIAEKIDLSNNSIRYQGDIEMPSFILDINDKKYEGKSSATLNIKELAFTGKKISGKVTSSANSFFYDGANAQLSSAISSENFKIALDEEKEIQSSVSIENLVLSGTKDNMNLTAAVKADNFVFSQNPGVMAKGNIIISNFSLEKNKTDLSLRGNVEIKNSQSTFAKNKFSGEVKALNSLLSIKDKKIDLHSDVSVANAIFESAQNISLRAEISLDGLRLRSADNRLELSAAPKIFQSSVGLGEGRNLKGDITFKSFSLNSFANILKINAEALVKDANLTLDKKITFAGYPHIALSCSIDKSDPAKNSYNGALNLSDASVNGVPYLGTVSGIKGSVSFDQNGADTKSLSFSSQGITVETKGSLENFLNPLLDLTATSADIDLDKVKNIYPDVFTRYNIDVSGNSALRVDFKGGIKNIKDADIRVTASLKDVIYNNPGLKNPITDISGDISYASNILLWKNLQGNFSDKTFILNGKLTNFSRPVLETTVSSREFTVNAKANILNGVVQFSSLAGNYLNSSFDLRGDIRLPKDIPINLDMRGALVLDLSDLSNISPLFNEKLSGVNPKGTLSLTELLLRGDPKDWRNLQLTFKGQSDVISLFGHDLNKVLISLKQRDNYISKLNISALVYEGEMTLESSADLSRNDVPSSIVFNLQDMKLARLRDKIKVRNKDFSGNLSSTFAVKGPIIDTYELTGTGKITIKDGLLGELLPGYEQTSFKEAYANFVIEKGRVIAQSGQLLSESVVLNLSGWLDFKKNLNFEIDPDLSKLSISGGLPVNPATILSELVSIKISGTLDKPNYSLKASPKKILQKTGDILGTTTDVLKDGIGTVLDNIFGEK